jgi:hypothetical protein
MSDFGINVDLQPLRVKVTISVCISFNLSKFTQFSFFIDYTFAKTLELQISSLGEKVCRLNHLRQDI